MNRRRRIRRKGQREPRGILLRQDPVRQEKDPFAKFITDLSVQTTDEQYGFLHRQKYFPQKYRFGSIVASFNEQDPYFCSAILTIFIP